MVFEKPLNVERARAGDFNQLREFFHLVDAEFLPPLSERDSVDDLVWRYLDDKESDCMICRNGMSISAAVAFEYLNQQHSSVYLTFFAVHPQHRRQGMGLAYRLKILTWLKQQGVQEVITRTWSTNRAMCRLNEQVGFLVDYVIPDDRGPGIDTIYYKKYL